MDISKSISILTDYAVKNGLIGEFDKIWARNTLIGILGVEDFDESFNNESSEGLEIQEILDEILDYAVKNKIIEDSIVYKDLLDTRLMGVITPRPSEVVSGIFSAYKAYGAKVAADMFYKFCQTVNYIRTDRIKKDLKWITKTEYGDIDITINLSKPEKDPKAIAAALKMKNSSYPKCQLCSENTGYFGRLNHPARENIRIIPITLNEENWYVQYSPYSYYNEHCIVFNEAHTPMVINKSTFLKLFDFVSFVPHYFVGSNADLPIVGGSILTHEHFQGGNYSFAMANSPIETELYFNGFEDIQAGIVKWPMSVIRLTAENPEKLASLSDKILTKWRSYTDEEANIYAYTDNMPHNTITPIVRMLNGNYQIDLVLRNNRTTKEYPDGIYHPHKEYHHLKKENIGLIEVMGLAVLPSRLKNEIKLLKDAMLSGECIDEIPEISKHSDWAKEILENHSDFNFETAEDIIKEEIGIVFLKILEQCGVFERTELGKKQFLRFVKEVNEVTN